MWSVSCFSCCFSINSVFKKIFNILCILIFNVFNLMFLIDARTILDTWVPNLHVFLLAMITCGVWCSWAQITEVLSHTPFPVCTFPWSVSATACRIDCPPTAHIFPKQHLRVCACVCACTYVLISHLSYSSSKSRWHVPIADKHFTVW